jgi:transcriptional regulator with XRE-family HTH domain
VVDEKQFFRAFGQRVKKLRQSKGYTQEDMIGFGFSARHWQQIEAGRPITIRTMLRICDTFGIRAAQMIDGLDRSIYRK